MNETNLHQWFRRIWTEGDRNAVHELLAPNAIIHELDEQGQDARGAEEFLVFFDRFRSALPDNRVNVEDVVVAGDKIAGRWTAMATHSGDHLGFPCHRPASQGLRHESGAHRKRQNCGGLEFVGPAGADAATRLRADAKQ